MNKFVSILSILINNIDKKFEKQKNLLLTILPYLIVAILLVVRNPVALFRAEFWAEDFTNIFREVYELGPVSIFTPVWGYHMFIPRLIGFISTFFPVIVAPYLYAVASLIFDTIAIGYFSRKGFSHIIPSYTMRVFICAMLSLAPGSGEVFLNLCNLTTVFTLIAILMFLEKPYKVTIWRIFVYTVLAFSAGQLFLFIPLLIFIFIITKDKKFLICCGILTLSMVINFIGVTAPASLTVQNGMLRYKNIVTIPGVIVDNFVIRLYYLPLFGRDVTEKIIAMPFLLFWGVSAIFLMINFIYIILKKLYKNFDFWAWGITYCSALGTFAVMAIIRTFVMNKKIGSVYYGQRFGFLTGVITIIILIATFRKFYEVSKLKYLAYTMTCLIIYHCITNWEQIYGRNDLNWKKYAITIQEAIDQKKAGKLDEPVIFTILVHPRWQANITISP